MSVSAKNWALSQNVCGASAASRAAARNVLNDLADWMIGEDATECYPTIEVIAFDTGFNRQTVMNAIKSLIEQGYLRRRFEWIGLKKKSIYSFPGYVPSEWMGSRRPVPRTFENSDVQDHGGTKTCTSEGPGSRTTECTGSCTTEGPGSCTYGGTGFRTVTRRKQGITRNKKDSYLSSCEKEEGDGAEKGTFPNAGDPKPERQANDDRPKKRAAKCPFTPDSKIPDDWRPHFAEKFPSVALDSEFSKFVDYHLSRGTTFIDWKAALRTWMSNARDWKAERDAREQRRNPQNWQRIPQSEKNYDDLSDIYS